MKECPQCNKVKDLSEFGKDRNRPSGKYPWCKPCTSYKTRTHAIKRIFGLEREDYEAYLELPCQICGKESEVLDHDHETGRIRGPLCRACNTILGLTEDIPERLERAAQYLRL